MSIAGLISLLTGKSRSARLADSFRTDFQSQLSPIVIGGCGRSGTTLMRMILDAHPRICCGPESHLFRERAVDPVQLADRFGLDTDTVRSLHAAALSRPEFIEGFAVLCMSRAGKQRWAEKTPRNILRVAEIFRHFPAARFIHMLRDGRDVACSLRTHPRHRVQDGRLVPLKTWKPIAGCARRWRDDIEASRSFWSDPRFLTLRYEDLVSDPARKLGELMTFIGEPWDDALLAHTDAGSPFRDVTRFAQSPEALDPVNTRSLSRWERDLNPEDRRTFKKIAGELLIELGYVQDNDW